VSAPKRALDRIGRQLKKYQAVLEAARARDVGENDTVVIIADLLADALGYDKYADVTTEFAIRGSYVDLAVKVGQTVRFLIEAKAIGATLKDSHIKQAIDYGANHGIEWVVLTNGIIWQMYKVHFKQPIDKSIMFEVDVLKANPKDPQVLEWFGHLSKEGYSQDNMESFWRAQQATSPYTIAAVLSERRVLAALRRELKNIAPKVRIEEDDLRQIVQGQVVKRELVDGDEARRAEDLIKRSRRAAARARNEKKETAAPTPKPVSTPLPAPPATSTG